MNQVSTHSVALKKVNKYTHRHRAEIEKVVRWLITQESNNNGRWKIKMKSKISRMKKLKSRFPSII